MPGANLTGTLTVAVNTGTRAVNETVVVDGVSTSLMLQAGPYLRVEGTGIRIEMFGQRVSGDIVLEKARSGGVDVVRVGLRNVSAAFGDGTTDLVTLSEGVGLLVITGPSGSTAGGLAGTLSGRVRMSVPGVGLDATLTLAINTRPTADGPVNEVLTFGDQPTTTAALVVGDVNGDGRADIVVGSAGKLFLYLNDGSGDPYDAVPAIVLTLAGRDRDGPGPRRPRRRQPPRAGRRHHARHGALPQRRCRPVHRRPDGRPGHRGPGGRHRCRRRGRRGRRARRVRNGR